MQDSEQQEEASNKNDKLMSEFAVTRRQSRSLYRNWAAVSKKSVDYSLRNQSNVFSKISTSSIGSDYIDYHAAHSSTDIENRVDEIVRHIEQSHVLAADNPKLYNDRRETLREMTEYLTLKRSVKRKLIKSIGSKNKTLSLSQRLKYKISIFFFKIPVTLKHFLSSFELWYSSLKVIESHFGSNVATYFKFLRKLFLLNACIFILMFFFVMTPQLLFRFIQYVDENNDSYSSSEYSQNGNESNFNSYYFNNQPVAASLVELKPNPYSENGEFRLGNLFTGEGFLTNTILFYGYYTNTSLTLLKGYSFNIPASYFFTSAVSHIIIFFFLFVSVAVSYRKCYIEASGGMHNTFSNKVLCGWDFGIATKQAAELKSKSIYIEIKELLDDLSKPKKGKTCANTFYTTAISFSLNSLLLFLMGVGGMYSWKYLDQQMTKADTATTMMMWLILTLVIAMAPVLFSFIVHIEGFESPSTALYMTLIRTFTLYAVVIAVVVAYRVNRSAESECWETVLGQDMFRLVVLDFIFGSIGTALSEFIRYRIFKKMWRGIGCPEFDIARSTMNLIYNQTLFYIGLFFSPVLSLLITIKLFIIFYVKKYGAIYNCKPFVKPWKAAQAHTVYLSIAFFAFFCVVIAYGYIITSVKTSNCGPFRGNKFLYESILEEISSENSMILMVFYYISRPGVVGIVLMAMSLGVYYMRAVALARIHVVKHLRHLLRLKAEERKLLLSKISKYTKGRDPPDASYNGSVLNSPSNDFRKFKENSLEEEWPKRRSNRAFFKDGKFAYSSLTDLQAGKDPRLSNLKDENEVFKSDPHISHYNFHEKGESNVSFQLRKDFCKLNFLAAAERKTSSQDNVSVGQTSHDASETFPVPNTSSADENNVCGNTTKLNFNPVFTESVPVSSDFDDEEIDVVSVDPEEKRSTDEKKKSADNTEEDRNVQSNIIRNYFKGEERVPSRISYK